jgi:TonB family protein
MRASEVGRPAFERAKPAGTTCFDPRPSVRMLAFPAFEEIEQPAGTVHFSWLAHDIGPDGRVRNVRLLGSSGNDELDRRSRAAISRSRFQPGARTGCVFEYHRRAVEPMPAPPPPEEESFRAAGATCPQEEPQWLHMPPLDFPAAFNRRSIEGWAIVSYDLAPWGETGNVRVLAAEPAAVFGDQAARIVREARTAGGDSGFVGCTARVIFLMPRDRSDSAD